jgi:hypothetical protein
MGVYQKKMFMGAMFGMLGVSMIMAAFVIEQCEAPPGILLFAASFGALLVLSGMLASTHYSAKIRRGQQALTPF